jgi:hypothetical protein
MIKIVSAIVAGSIALAAPAGADPSTFVGDVYDLGIEGITDSDLVELGFAICRELANGEEPETIAAFLHYRSAVGNGEDGIELDTARAEVTLAIIDLCPEVAGGHPPLMRAA